MIAQSDRQGMDWFEAGRERAGTMLWTEDWWVTSQLCAVAVL
jgi:hypothetical protein